MKGRFIRRGRNHDGRQERGYKPAALRGSRKIATGSTSRLDLDEQRRGLVIQTLVGAEVLPLDPYAMVESLQLVDDWLRTGIVPKKPGKTKTTKLKPFPVGLTQKLRARASSKTSHAFNCWAGMCQKLTFDAS